MTGIMFSGYPFHLSVCLFLSLLPHLLCLLMHSIHSFILHNIWVTVSPWSLYPGTGTDSDRMTRLTTYCREHTPSLVNVVSTTPVRPPGTLCHLTYMILLTLTYSRNDLKLFCLIVRTDLLLLLYGAPPGRFVERRVTNLSLHCIVLVSSVLCKRVDQI